jgi:hypothetical protein
MQSAQMTIVVVVVIKNSAYEQEKASSSKTIKDLTLKLKQR